MEPTKAALNIPNEVYYVAGVLLIANLGTIVSIIFAAFKAVWWASKLDSKVDDARATAVRAHKRIDTLEREDSGEDESPRA